ncbi:hypothetical protein DFQ29_007206 [Apophysomyces sp. BC1021]|nr:hypothetical protein DFQ29_007206 [Apophysomyces sp. BC1021]
MGQFSPMAQKERGGDIFEKDRLRLFETTYNYRLLWPALDAALDVVPTVQDFNLEFVPGEIHLKAMQGVTKARTGNDDSRCGYNVDGVVYISNLNNLELWC